MKVSEVMTRDVATVRPDQPVQDAASFMLRADAGSIPVVEGERLEWHQGDLFALPPWKWHQHENTSGGDTILFSIDDWPAMQKLGFYMDENDG